MSIELQSTEEAAELLRTYSPEEIRQLWENGAFKGNTNALQDYLFKRIMEGDLESDPDLD